MTNSSDQTDRTRPARAVRAMRSTTDRRVVLEFSSLGRLDDAPPRLRRAVADRLERLLAEAEPGAGIVSVQVGVDLLTWDSRNAAHAIFVSLIVPVPPDAALLPARPAECEPIAGMAVTLDVYEDDRPDGTFALMKVVIRP